MSGKLFGTAHSTAVNRLVAVGLCLFVLAACGSESNESSPRGGQDATDISVTTARAADLVQVPGRGAVVVDGLHETGSGQRTTRLWYETDSGYASSDADRSSPLMALDAWWDGDEVVIIGNFCPEWSPDRAALGEELSLTELCGRDDQRVVAFEPATASWRTVAETLESGYGGPAAASSSGSLALLTGSPGGALLDTDTGNLTSLSGLPDHRTEMQLCTFKDQAFSVQLVTDQAFGPGGGDGEGSVVGYRLSGTEWKVSPIAGDVPQEAERVGCLDGTIVLQIRNAGEVRLIAVEIRPSGGLAARSLPIVPIDESVIVEADDGLAVLAWQPPLEPPGDSAPRKAATFSDGAWASRPELDLADARSTLVVASSVLVVPDEGSEPSRIELR